MTTEPAAPGPTTETSPSLSVAPFAAQPSTSDAPRAAASRPRLHIAMIGQRGAPATFGGVEHHVEELGARLADRGHRVTVYCRYSYGDDRPSYYRGMELKHLHSVSTKHFDAITHSANAVVHALGMRPDIIHFHALGPGLVAPMARLGRAKVVQTVHGLDADRAKWGKGASRVLKLGERMSARVPDRTIVVSHALEDYYRDRYSRATWVFPNGVSAWPRACLEELKAEHGLTEGGYLLYVGRIVPEKRLDFLLSAYRHMGIDVPLVIAGGDSFSSDYLRQVREQAARDPRVLMLGYVYGERLRALYSNAAAFILPSVLEGMPLTLLEAASFATPIVASEIPPHVEVLGHSRPGAQLFEPNNPLSLAKAIEKTLAGGDVWRRGAAQVREHVIRNYDWDEMTDHVEGLYYETLDR